MKIDRLLGIVVVLLSKRRSTAKKLAELFEVSERTIYRDIDTINMAGIPVVSQQGAGGGIGIMRGFTMDRQVVNMEELASMVTALQIAQGLDNDKQYARVRSKIESMVPDRHRQLLQQVQDSVAVDVVPWGYGPELRLRLADLHQAVANHKLLAFVYLSGKGESLARQAEPHKLIFKGYHWYLYAFCRRRAAFRLFKLSRIRELAILDEVFAPRDISGYAEKIVGDYNAHGPADVEVVLHFAPEARMRLEDSLREDELERHTDGSFTARLRFPEDEWVYNYILSFGDLVTVKAPPHLRDAIREKAKAILDKHR